MGNGRSPVPGSGCQPSASAAEASSRSGIPNAESYLVEAIRRAQLDVFELCARIGDEAARRSRETAKRCRRHPMQGLCEQDYVAMADELEIVAQENEAYAGQIRALAQGMSAFGQDPQGLEAKPASPVAKPCAQKDPSHD